LQKRLPKINENDLTKRKYSQGIIDLN